MTRKYPLIRIDWTDATTCPAWREVADVLKWEHGTKIHSIGWLLRETKDFYVIGQSLSANEKTDAVLEIPKRWATKKTVIKGHTIEYNQGS